MEPMEDLLRSFYFVIPLNQRGYSWRIPHAKALIEDLELMGDKSHYLGTITTTYRGSENDFRDDVTRRNIKGQILDDGQQRITTFFLLFHALKKCFEDIGQTEDDHYKDLKGFLIYHNGGPKLRLENENEELHQYLSHLILGASEPASRTPPMLALKEVSNYFYKRLSGSNLETLIEWKLRTSAQAKLILVDLASEDIDRYLAFDAMNSRGLPLTEFDKIKNFCALLADRRPGLENLNAEREWYKSLEALVRFNATSRKVESTYIAEAHSVFYNTKVGTENIHEDFVKRYEALLTSDDNTKEDELRRFVNTWKDYASAFGYLFSTERKIIESTRSTVRATDWLTNIDHMGLPGITRTILTAALLKFDRGDFEKVARWCEIYSFRVRALALRRTDINSNSVISLAHRILVESIDVDFVGSTLCEWLDSIAPLQSAFDFLANGGVKYYFDQKMKGWEYCYYFLYQYELSQIHGGASPIEWEETKSRQKSSIEHILPQTRVDGDWWAAHWPDENQFEKFKHRLGNLVLTNGNSVLGRKKIKLKLDDPSAGYYYNYTGATNSEKLVTTYTNGINWKKEEILRREYDLIVFALNRWSMNCCSDNGSYRFPEEFTAIGLLGEYEIQKSNCIPSSTLTLEKGENESTAEEIESETADSEQI